MNEKYSIILNLLNGRLNELPSETDWRGVFEFAQTQGVAAIVWDNIYEILQGGASLGRVNAEGENLKDLNVEMGMHRGDSKGIARE